MPRNEQQTSKDLIEPALEAAGWHWECEVMIGPGRVNLTRQGKPVDIGFCITACWTAIELHKRIAVDLV